jgi:hypothetical protein
MNRPIGLALGAALAAQLVGCSPLSARADSPADVAPREFPKHVRLTLNDGSTVELFQSRLVGDSIHGSLANTTPTAVATAAVTSWEGSRRSGSRTLVAIGVLTVILIVTFAAFSQGSIGT